MTMAMFSKGAFLLTAFSLFLVLAFNLDLSNIQSASSTRLEGNILDGCHHVYLDMGTNM